MKKPFHHHIHTAAHEVSLSEAERARMRDTITAYMAMKPVRTTHADTTYRAFSFLEIIFSPRLVTLVLIGAILGSSAGVSYAAESALPGDTLYSVKTRIIEPVRGALATTPKAKKDWALQVADERAKEAATLAAENKLDAATQTELETSFRTHAKLASQAIQETVATDPITGSQEAARFEARLSEYERVITALAPEPEKHAVLAAALRDERTHIATVREKAEHEAGENEDRSLREAAHSTLASAEQRVRVSQRVFSTSTAEEISLQLTSASATLALDNTTETGTDKKAALRKTLRNAEALDTFVETSAAIHARTGLVIERSDKKKTRTNESKIAAATKTAPAPQETARVATMSAPAADIPDMARMAATSAPATTTETSEQTEPKEESSKEGLNEPDGEDRDNKRIHIPLPELEDADDD